MFWCVLLIDDDDFDFKEVKWLFIMNYFMNRYFGYENLFFFKCVYGRLYGRERKKKWFKLGI